MQKFVINGGNPLCGEVRVSGSKNAALPIIAASILVDGVVELTNVPQISDVHIMLEILQEIGAVISRGKGRVRIDSRGVKKTKISSAKVQRLRGSILFLGPLLSRFGNVWMDYPGGCVIGKRPAEAHLFALQDLGARIYSQTSSIHLEAKKLKAGVITLWEPSVTATENAILASVLTSGQTEIKLATMEPHIQDLCFFLRKAGAKIKGIGTPYLKIQGVKNLKPVKYRITSDYLEGGALAIAAALLPGSKVTLRSLNAGHLDAFWNKFKEVGVRFELERDRITVWGRKKLTALRKLDTRLFPYFPTDLQAPFAVLLSQAEGVSKIFETLFENRLNYLFELEKMGARVEILNPHQALIIGPVHLKAAAVNSCDLRAGCAMVLAGLVAQGCTEVLDINYVDRGYENFDGKLRMLGARVDRI